MKWTRKKRLNSLVGLSLHHGKFRAVHVARNKGSVEVIKMAAAPLSLDLLHPEVELVGREIRNHFEAGGIRERHCIIDLPADWIMSQQTRLPELSADDTTSFLQIEAEKDFPCDPAQLQIARSVYRSSDSAYVTQLAVRQEQLMQLAAVLKSAGLKPVSFSLGLATLPGVISTAGSGKISLLVEPDGATLLISAGGGITAFRTFESTIESEAGENLLNGPALARQLRITFEQVPTDLRLELRELNLMGDATMVSQLTEILSPWANDVGLTLNTPDAASKPVADALLEHLASRCIATGTPALEFLPPRPSQWSRMMARYSSKRLATAGFAVGAAAVVALAVFGWQEYRRWSLRAEWTAMEANVTALEAVQARIREYRPWYDTTSRNLTILQRVTECFPENGSVTAKSLEINGAGSISVSGTARDNPSLLRTLDQLRQAKEVKALKIEQIRGKTPAQFTFTFRWNAAPGT